MGLPLGCAEIGAQLWGKHLNYYPDDPQWLNRDRFILSAGHGSMFIYSWLHLSGYALPLKEVMNFRRLHSMTPGHPEFPSSEVKMAINLHVSITNLTLKPSYSTTPLELRPLLVLLELVSEMLLAWPLLLNWLLRSITLLSTRY